jgi:prepilin-type N-terminal cleavage/methylation domain-containing protein
MTNRGFTLIEIAVVLALAGLVTTAGLILLPKLWHEKQRVETGKYLLAAKEALLTYAADHNALPAYENAQLLPTTTLKLKQRDSFDRPLRYIVNSKLLPGADKTLPCKTLQEYVTAYLAWRTAADIHDFPDFPHLWQHGLLEAGVPGVPVAAVLVSRGANGELDKYIADDGVTLIGDNSTTNLVQAPASESFDDLVAYLTIPELINALPECRQ